MSPRADDFRLLFTLPPRLAFAVPPGRHHPCIAGAILDVSRALERGARQIEVTGISREIVFEQTRRFLRIVGKGHGAEALPATLVTPARGLQLGGRDGWSIIVNATVSFSPSSVPPDIGIVELERLAG